MSLEVDFSDLCPVRFCWMFGEGFFDCKVILIFFSKKAFYIIF